MQTSIHHVDRRAHARHDAKYQRDLAHILKPATWLSWPLIYWNPEGSAEPATKPAAARILYRILCEKLKLSPHGMYAVRPLTSDSQEILILPIQQSTLVAAGRALAGASKTFEGAEDSDEARTIERLQPRLAIAEASYRELQSRISLERSVVIRKRCWQLGSGAPQPPTEPLRGCQHSVAATAPEIRWALLELDLREKSRLIPSFLKAFETLQSEFACFEEERERRQGVMLSLLKQADEMEPAYLPVSFESPKHGKIQKWKPNPEFEKTAVLTFFRAHYVSIVTPPLTHEERKRLKFSKMSLWLLGEELKAFERRPLPELQNKPCIVREFVEHFHRSSAPSSAVCKAELASIAAQFVAATNDVSAVRSIVNWMAACRPRFQQTKDPLEIWQVVIRSLDSWLQASRYDAGNITRLFELLDSRAKSLFCRYWLNPDGIDGEVTVLATLGGIPYENALAMLDLDLTQVVHEQFAGKLQSLAAFLNLTRRHRAQWSLLDNYVRRWWISLFADTRDRALLAGIVRWIEKISLEHRLLFGEASGFVWRITWFLNSDLTGEERAKREAFLARHFGLFDELLNDAARAIRDLPEKGFDDLRCLSDAWESRFQIVMITYRWEEAGFKDQAILVRRLMAYCQKRDRQSIAENKTNWPTYFDGMWGMEALIVRLSGGRVQQFAAFFGYFIRNWNHPDNPLEGWNYLERFPEIRQTLLTLCADPGRLRWCVNILRRIAVSLRLQRRATLSELLGTWMAAQEISDPLDSLHAFTKLARNSTGVTRRLGRALSREQSLHNEYHALLKMRGDNTLSASAEVRLKKLEKLLSQPDAVREWVKRDAEKLILRRLPYMKVWALGTISRRVVRSHWKAVIDPVNQVEEGSDWDNALHFYYTAEKKNKEVLRKLLRNNTADYQEWRLHHPPNAKFLKTFAENGFRPETWLAPYRKTVELRGEIWTVFVESNPLRILQMGNLFGTCLSVDDVNAFSAIANAVEINKQVLYITDDRDTVIGRKLIGLTADGKLFGFRSYGAACLDEPNAPGKTRSWIKILFDIACLELVRRIGGEFAPCDEKAADRLRLAADWYNDGPESFDWWIQDRELSAHVLAGNKRPIAQAVRAHLWKLHEDSTGASIAPDMATLRAIAWLGESADLLVEESALPSLTAKHARFLSCQTVSARLRESLKPASVLETVAQAKAC